MGELPVFLDVGLEVCFQSLHLQTEIAVGGDAALNLADGIEHCGVVAPAEFLADLRLAHLGVLLGKVHGELAHEDDVGLAALLNDFALLHLEMLAEVLEDVLEGDIVAGEVDYASHNTLGKSEVYFAVVHHAEGHQAVDDALEVAHVISDVFGNIIDHIGGEAQTRAPYLGGNDVAAQHDVGAVHLHDDAPLETGEHTFLNAFEEHGGAVAGDDNLAAVEVEVVEDVEKGVLRVGGGEFLYIVYDKDIDRLIKMHELVDIVVANGVGILRLEEVGGHKEHALLGEFLFDAVAYGRDEVGLAYAGGAVEEERVEGGLVGLFGDGLRNVEGRLVADALDEVLEGELRVEMRVKWLLLGLFCTSGGGGGWRFVKHESDFKVFTENGVEMRLEVGEILLAEKGSEVPGGAGEDKGGVVVFLGSDMLKPTPHVPKLLFGNLQGQLAFQRTEALLPFCI